MRLLTLVTTIALVTSTAALAQNGAGGNGDGPQNRGSTGWTGAHPETGGATNSAVTPGKPATTGQAVEVHDQDLARDQPFMATGEDLNGPGTEFAPSQTPE